MRFGVGYPLWATVLCLSAIATAPASAANKTRIPASNMVENPTFKKSASGWSGKGSRITRVKARSAPHGSTAARVRASRQASHYTMDDSPSTIEAAVAGVRYTGSAWVKGARSTVGRKIALAVREWSASGTFVGSTVETVRLRAKFTQVTSKYIAAENGGEIDVFLERPKGTLTRDDAFFADAVTLRTEAVNPEAEEAITTSQLAIVSDHEPQLFQEAGAQYRYIVVRDNMHDQLGELRSVHPESDLVLYKNIAFTQDEPGGDCPWYPFQSGGLSYCHADAHEDWFLHHKWFGWRLTSEGYSAQRAMNIANPAYRQAWADAVIARLADARGDGSGVRYDGVWIDDANMFPSHGMDGQIAELSDAAYRTAMVEFIDYAAARIEAAGFTTFTNLAANPWEPAERAASLQVAADVDVVNREGFVRWGEGRLFTSDGDAAFWDYELEFAEDIAAAGAALHTLTYGRETDLNAQRYARATFLLAWNGRDGSASNFRTMGPGVTTWLPDWTIDVGVPISERYKVGAGWRRDYSGGAVLVNPKSSQSVTFELRGGHRTAEGCVSAVTLPPTRALILPPC